MAVIDLHRIVAVIFETDGVLTDTARVHAHVWKGVLDAYLRRHAQQSGGSWRPFDVREDYLRYVDGKPRIDGARDFLASRGIALKGGDEGEHTLSGMACLKDGMFLAEIRRNGVAPFPPAVALLHELRLHRARIAAISPSRNCAEILTRAGISRMIDVRVDGVDAAATGLPPMPDPAMLAKAARRLGTDPYETAVIAATAPALHAAGNGHFGLVIALRGPDRVPTCPAPRADYTVENLTAIQIAGRVAVTPRL
ncbi:HAD family hydrolase [Nonomuraea sp. 3N208]|uniref:HAD family hydrolase n=1 Tax=Nonomuraea sp. 3N208 TaxID=3457421 RepID=UPI003FD58726